jgi:hypothetical protein
MKEWTIRSASGRAPTQIFIGRAEGLEVVGPVVPGRAVGARAVRGQLLGDVRVSGRPLEHQVLEQVRHTGLAVVLVAGTDEVGDVDRNRLLGRVGEEQHAQPVSEAVLGDSLDRGHAHGFRRWRRFRRCRGRGAGSGKSRENERREGLSERFHSVPFSWKSRCFALVQAFGETPSGPGKFSFTQSGNLNAGRVRNT